MRVNVRLRLFRLHSLTSRFSVCLHYMLIIAYLQSIVTHIYIIIVIVIVICIDCARLANINGPTDFSLKYIGAGVQISHLDLDIKVAQACRSPFSFLFIPKNLLMFLTRSILCRLHSVAIAHALYDSVTLRHSSNFLQFCTIHSSNLFSSITRKMYTFRWMCNNS